MIPLDERPVLASRAGRYVEALPVQALRAHFQCVWTNAVAPSGPARFTVIPDGCVDLLWRDGRFAVVGPDIVASTPALSPGSTIIGLRFQPGAAARWLGLPLTEIVGREIAMAEFWGREAERVADQLAGAATVAAQARVFQQAMARHATAFDRPPREASAVFALLGAGAENEARRTAALHDRLNMSERTLRRWSRAHFGYGVKTLDRILRFQKFRTLALGGAGERLAGLAFAAGYADQAHLSREIQNLCGMTTTEFVRQL